MYCIFHCYIQPAQQVEINVLYISLLYSTRLLKCHVLTLPQNITVLQTVAVFIQTHINGVIKVIFNCPNCVTLLLTVLFEFANTILIACVFKSCIATAPVLTKPTYTVARTTNHTKSMFQPLCHQRLTSSLNMM